MMLPTRSERNQLAVRTGTTVYMAAESVCCAFARTLSFFVCFARYVGADHTFIAIGCPRAAARPVVVVVTVCVRAQFARTRCTGSGTGQELTVWARGEIPTLKAVAVVFARAGANSVLLACTVDVATGRALVSIACACASPTAVLVCSGTFHI